MQILSIADPGVWALAGMSILVVFVILVLIIAVLYIFAFVAKKTANKAVAVKESHIEKKQVKTLEKSEQDKAAVAMALYLYLSERENRENRILTIKPTPDSAWGSQLNPRL